jgi:hypothetical protein
MAVTMTREENLAINEALAERLFSRDEALFKEATEMQSDYTRTMVRDNSILDAAMPPLPVTKSMLSRDLHSEDPRIVIDLEPWSPGAVSISYNDTPEQFFIKARRYEAVASRIATKRATKDEAQLMTWVMDLRQVMGDHFIRDILDRLDFRFFRAFNRALVGEGAVVMATGAVQWQTLYGGVSRDTVVESTKIMPSTPFNLEAETAIINHITYKEFMKMPRGEAGGDLSEDLLINGVGKRKLFKIENWIVTNKRSLVPNNNIFFLAGQNFVGRNYEFEPVVMWARRDGPKIQFAYYTLRGGAIGNFAGIARATFR